MTSAAPCSDCLRPLVWLAALTLLAIASGCAPKIGDKCTLSTDCSATGDRLCDSTEPAGYCTVFNCEPNACPDNSLCVAFNEPTCKSPAESVRFERTFCMATCGSDGDCRAGYKCLDITHDDVRQVLDINPSTHSICSVAPPPPVGASTSTPAVCNAFDGSFPESGVAPDDAADSASSETGSEPAPDATSDANADVIDPTGDTSDATPADAASE